MNMQIYLNDNDMGSSGLSLEFLKDENTLIKLKEILYRYENSPNKYSEEIMTYLRQRRGLDKYDISQDEEINKMDKSEVFNDVLS